MPIRVQTSQVQFSSSVVPDSLRSHEPQHIMSITNSQSLPKLTSIELVMTSNHLIICHPLLLLPSIFPNIRVFSNDSVLHINHQNIGVSALISVLQMNTQDRSPLGCNELDLFAGQGTLKSLLQHHSQKHQFFSTQLSL